MKLTLTKGANLNDKRVRDRGMEVLELAYDMQLRPSGGTRMYANDFYKIVGQPNRLPGSYFKHLFVHSAPYKKASRAGDGGKAFAYRTVPKRVQALADKLGVKNGLSAAAARKGWSFLDTPGTRAELPRTNDRVYPWWTTLGKPERKILFLEQHGHGFDYDIEAAKPTITLQAWRKLMAIHKPTILKFSEQCKLPMWSALVSNRKLFRETLARDVGINTEQAKWVCQSVLNSGFASIKNDSYVEKIGVPAIKRLMANEQYKGLRADFQVFWKYLREMPLNWGEAKTAGEVLSAFYNSLEDRVMNVIESTLTVRAWFIHDGFMALERIDIARAERAVRDELNLDVKIEETEISRADESEDEDGENGNEEQEQERADAMCAVVERGIEMIDTSMPEKPLMRGKTPKVISD